MTQQQEPTPTYRFFLSYAQDDSTFAHMLRQRLTQYPDARVFADVDLSAGEDWQNRIMEEIRKCTVFLVLVSEHTMDSTWVLSELGAAWALSKRVVPVEISSDPKVFFNVPIELRKVQWVSYKDLLGPRGISRLLEIARSEAD